MSRHHLRLTLAVVGVVLAPFAISGWAGIAWCFYFACCATAEAIPAPGRAR